MSKASLILDILIRRSNFVSQLNSADREYYLKKINDAVLAHSPIEFLLPAFPAKSANREKTLGHLPDLGEVEALKNLERTNREIQEIYTPGAKIKICSDGRVFSDLVCLTEQNVTDYQDSLARIKEEFELSSIEFFNLEDAFEQEISFQSMRDILVEKCGEPIETIREKVLSDKSYNNMFNGIHRFLKEDYLVIYSEFSKNKINKISKTRAYQVIQRSNAWSRYVEQANPSAFRLSIHPQLPGSYKFPVKLMNSDENWATPWHRSPVLEKGVVVLKRHKDILSSGLRLNQQMGYAFYGM